MITLCCNIYGGIAKLDTISIETYEQFFVGKPALTDTDVIFNEKVVAVLGRDELFPPVATVIPPDTEYNTKIYTARAIAPEGYTKLAGSVKTLTHVDGEWTASIHPGQVKALTEAVARGDVRIDERVDPFKPQAVVTYAILDAKNNIVDDHGTQLVSKNKRFLEDQLAQPHLRKYFETQQESRVNVFRVRLVYKTSTSKPKVEILEEPATRTPEQQALIDSLSTGTPPKDSPLVSIEIARLRNAQKAKGFDAAHDDEHTDGVLAQVAGLLIADGQDLRFSGSVKPEDSKWVDKLLAKCRGDRRRQLLEAAAMLVAEIERMDRAKTKQDADARTDYTQFAKAATNVVNNVITSWPNAESITYVGENKYPVSFDRFVTPKFTKDVEYQKIVTDDPEKGRVPAVLYMGNSVYVNEIDPKTTWTNNDRHVWKQRAIELHELGKIPISAAERVIMETMTDSRPGEITDIRRAQNRLAKASEWLTNKRIKVLTLGHWLVIDRSPEPVTLAYDTDRNVFALVKVRFKALEELKQGK